MRLRAAVIVLSGVLVYANGLSGPFMFDDENSIISNPTIRQVWPPSVPLSPPRDTPVAGRPLVNLSFALNYAASGLDVRAFRAVNLAVHLLSALVLLGIIRRTLQLPKVADVMRGGTPRLTGREGPPYVGDTTALNLAFACALVWALHPLNTEVVNYLSQRTEALMGLFYLLTLYCAIRGSELPNPGPRAPNPGPRAPNPGPRAPSPGSRAPSPGSRAPSPGSRIKWHVAAVACCVAGMACKESMVTAPVIVVLYDRLFLFDSVREVFRQRWRFYVGLSASWLVLVALMSGQPRTSAGFGSGADPWVYFLNQIDIIVHYLHLTVWPRALVLDYGLPQPLTIGEVILPAAIFIALGVATLVALRYRPLPGFLGAWFFITLAPTSSFVPIATEVGAERRMYLPLAGLVVLGVIGLYALVARNVRVLNAGAGRGVTPRQERRPVKGRPVGKASARDASTPLTVKVGVALFACVCVLLAIGTMARNREYRSRLSIAETNVKRRPNGRAHFHLGAELVFAGQQHERALEEFRASARDYPGAHFALATELGIAGEAAEAAAHAREFIRLMPGDTAVIPARELLARALATQGQLDAAAEQFTLIMQRAPTHVASRVMLGDLRLGQRRVADAIAAYEAAAQLRPADPDVLRKLGFAQAVSGRTADAVRTFERAVAARPRDPGLLSMLGRALAAEGHFSKAADRFRQVLELTPDDGQAAQNLAMAEESARR